MLDLKTSCRALSASVRWTKTICPGSHVPQPMRNCDESHVNKRLFQQGGDLLGPKPKLGYVISIVKISLSSLRKLKSFIVREGDEDYFSQKLRVRIKDNNNSPHGKFHRFLFPFFSKFSDLNFVSYVLYNLPVLCHVSQTASLEGSDIDGCMEKENITKIKY